MLMTAEMVGAYWLLLLSAWVNGSIPGELREIAALCRVSPRRMPKVWEIVGRCWQDRGDGRLVNPRMEGVRQEQEAYRDQQRKKAESRWQQQMERPADAAAMPVHCSATASSSASAQQEPPKVPPRGTEPHLIFSGRWIQITDEQHAEFTAAYPWLNLREQYAAMDAWCEDNPKRRPKNASRFARHWLDREPRPRTGRLPSIVSEGRHDEEPAPVTPEEEAWRAEYLARRRRQELILDYRRADPAWRQRLLESLPDAERNELLAAASGPMVMAAAASA
jgi:uncharacterized protein YdaU (DUF1376 family)